MELLGKSLEDLVNSIEDKKFSVRCVCNIGIQIIKIIKKVHDKHLIHRDIKPDNFVIGVNSKKMLVYLIDFGLAKKYRSKSTLQQIPIKYGKKLTGTARYASINALAGVEQSRRDDLESVGYSFVYLIKGSLPWQGLKVKKKEDRYRIILDKKRNISSQQLCKGLPSEIADYLDIVKKLEYEEEPNYIQLSQLLIQVLEKNDYSFDYYCDWTTTEYKEYNKEYKPSNSLYNKKIDLVNGISLDESNQINKLPDRGKLSKKKVNKTRKNLLNPYDDKNNDDDNHAEIHKSGEEGEDEFNGLNCRKISKIIDNDNNYNQWDNILSDNKKKNAEYVNNTNYKHFNNNNSSMKANGESIQNINIIMYIFYLF